MTTQPAGTRSPGGSWRAGQVSYEQPSRGRLARLFETADRRHVPLRTILVTAGVVVATYLAGKLLYLLRDIVLLLLVAGFVAMLLSPAVAKVQRRVPRRGRRRRPGPACGQAGGVGGEAPVGRGECRALGAPRRTVHAIMARSPWNSPPIRTNPACSA